MKRGHKIFAHIVLFTFLFTSGGNNVIFALNNNTDLAKNVIIAKYELKEIPKGVQYVKQIDTIISNYKENKKVLEKIQNRAQKVLEKIPNPKTKSEREAKVIMSYLDAQVKYALLIIATKEQEAEEQKAQDLENIIKNKAIQVMQEIEESTLGDSEIKKVDNAIINIQQQLFDTGTKQIITLKDQVKKYYNYKETGDLSTTLQGTIEGESVDFKLLLNNYEVIQNNLNQQIKTDIDLFFEHLSEDKDIKEKLQASGELDFISKDGVYYTLLDNYKYSHENLPKYAQDVLENLDKIAEAKGYVKYEDENMKDALSILQNFNIDKIIKDGRILVSEPFLTAYKKDGEKYYLIPTKYACETIKATMNRIDPFYGKNCSDNQYQEVLENFLSTGELYIDLSNKNISSLGFTSHPEISERISAQVNFSATEITQLFFNIISGENYKILMDYKKNSVLNYEFMNKSYNDTEIKFTSKLDRNNNFSFIDLQYSDISKSKYKGDSHATLSLENRNISGKITSQGKKYDYENNDYIDGSLLNIDISGKTDYSNVLSSLDISYTNNDTFVGKLQYKNNSITFDHSFENDSSKADITIGAIYNSNEKLITDGSIIIKLFQKHGTYNYETYEYIYDEDFSKVFDTNFNINNKNISGVSQFYNKDNNIFGKINTNGSYTKESLSIKNNYSFQEDKKDITGNLNVQLDTSNNKQNFSILFDMFEKDNINIIFKMENTGLTDYNIYEIKTPSQTIDANTLTQ